VLSIKLPVSYTVPPCAERIRDPQSCMTTPSGSRPWKLLLVTGAILMFVAGLLVVTSRNILNSTRFGANVAASLGDDRVAAYVAEQVTDAIIAQKPDMLAIRPILLSSVRSIVVSEPFRAAVRTSARSAHRFFFEQAGSRLVFSLPDIGTVVRSALAQASPEMAAKIPPGIEAQLSSGKVGRAISTFLRLWKLGDTVLTVAWIAWYAGIVFIVLAIVLAPDKRRGVTEAGVALVTIAVVYLSIVPTLRLVISAAFQDPAMAGFVHGMIKAFLGRLRLVAILAGVPGLVLLAAGSEFLEQVDPLDMARRLLHAVVTPPAGRALRVAWALGLLLAGTVALVWPVALVTGVVVLVGIALLHGGLREIFAIVIGRIQAGELAGSAVEGRRWPIAVGAAAVVVGLGGVGAWLLRSDGGETPVASTTLCNGAASLCSKRVDQVVFPMAHNAMSNSTIDDWMFPHHTQSLAGQLEYGARGLAIDIHYGIPTGGRVKTDIDAEVSSRDKIEGALGPEGVAAAMRIRDRLVGGEGGTRGLYFCHGFCELGAYPVIPSMTAIKDWVAANPGEVIILIIEDYVTTAEMDSLFIESGLVRYVYRGSVTQWPTLRELIDSNQRVIVFIESGHPGVDYMRPAFESISETPYTFHKPEDFSCRPNRGKPMGSLFMINHWIESTPAPRPSNAAIVNAYDFLLARARKCQRERGHLPNIVMVDFVSVGDLLRVTRTLNGVPEPVMADTTRH